LAWLDDETTAFVHSGCALILGTVAPDGDPCAGRGWGLAVADEPRLVRLLVDADDEATMRNITDGAAVAITAASIRTLRSVQFKGRVTGTDPAGPDDLAKAEAYCAEMFTDIHETDFTPRELLEELRPHRLAACTVQVEERFDQTPGPTAGARLGGP
jgi:Pyridoxamine 5'-phosphate oxidase